MSHSGINMAVTEDGAKYNKLSRPEVFIESLSTNPAPRDPAAPVEAANTKRTVDEANLNDDASREEKPKRSRTQQRATNAESGMQSMFPGMLDEAELSDDSTTNEALAYLRSVRTEASTIPNLLLAPHEPEDPEETLYRPYKGPSADYHVVFQDGTWIARDPHYYNYESSYYESDDLDPQEQYYKRLLSRYHTMRNKLASMTAVPEPKPNKTFAMAIEVPRSRHEWLYSLEREYPSPALAAQMDDRDVFHGIKYAAHSLDKFRAITKQKSCWIWMLLALTPESGTLDYAKAGIVRDLGHKAGQFGMRLRCGTFEAVEKHERDGEEYEGWDVDAEGYENYDEDGEDEGEQGRITDRVTGNGARASGDAHEPDEPRPGSAMSLVEDGEVRSDEPGDEGRGKKQAESKERHVDNCNDDPTTLEEARARLLAQLGDRLVQPQANTTPSHSNSPKTVFLSRAAAEAERQRLRDEAQKAAATATAAAKAEHSASPIGAPLQTDGPADLAHTRSQISQELELQAALATASAPDSGSEEASPRNSNSNSNSQPAKPATSPDASADIGAIHIHIPDLNSRATIDIILTVVAECYGQRDLLRFRDAWVG